MHIGCVFYNFCKFDNNLNLDLEFLFSFTFQSYFYKLSFLNRGYIKIKVFASKINGFLNAF